MKIIIEEENCIGCGACTAISENTFALNDEGIAYVIIDNVNPDDETVIDAIESCPTGAIIKE